MSSVHPDGLQCGRTSALELLHLHASTAAPRVILYPTQPPRVELDATLRGKAVVIFATKTPPGLHAGQGHRHPGPVQGVCGAAQAQGAPHLHCGEHQLHSGCHTLHPCSPHSAREGPEPSQHALKLIQLVAGSLIHEVFVGRERSWKRAAVPFDGATVG